VESRERFALYTTCSAAEIAPPNPPALPSSVQAPMGTTNDLLDPEGLSEKGPRIPKQGPELFTTVWSACGFEGP